MLVSVVLPAYNAELYLREAIDSILAQTFKDYELIILNDGSTDTTENIILSYDDSRIVYIKNEKNLGLIDTLNKGMSLSKGKYIARMDADDICFPERFQKQVEFLEGNPKYVICGTSAYRFKQDISDVKAFNVPLNDDNIRARLFFNSGFIHPSVMFRTAVVKENNLVFNQNFKYAEDYYFWIDLLMFGKGYNLKDKLLYYRVVENSQTAVGNSNIENRKKIIGNIHRRYFNDYQITLDENEIELNFYLTNITRMKLIDLNRFNFIDVSNLLYKILSLSELCGISRKAIYEEVSRVYFALVYTKKIESIFTKGFLKKSHPYLLVNGALFFLKDRISR